MHARSPLDGTIYCPSFFSVGAPYILDHKETLTGIILDVSVCPISKAYTWHVVRQIHKHGVLAVIGVRVRRNAAIRTGQNPVLVLRAVVGNGDLAGGVFVLLPELAQLFDAERLAREEGGGSLQLLHHLGTLGVGRSVAHQVC